MEQEKQSIEQTKKCSKCGEEILASTKVCKHCKADLRNWFVRHKIITGILILIIIGIIASAGGSKDKGSNKTADSTPAAPDNIASTTANNSASNSTAAKASAPAQNPTPATQTLLDLTGSGTKTTQKFTAGGDWDLNWTYNCAKFSSQGNFQVMIYNGDGSMSVDNSIVNQLGSKDSGVEHYHTGGTFYLVVNSECAWTIKVQG